MPKEHVEGLNCHPDVLEGQASPWQVVVGWSKDAGTLQVATIDPNMPPFSRESGLHVDLDRTGINKLIRLLRKARDGAYGRDE